MKRFAAHYLYCSPQKIITNGAVEVDNEGRITRFFSLSDYPEETHSTIFFNGVLIPGLFVGDELKNYSGKPVFETLDYLFSISKNKLEEGEILPIFLLENLNLSEKTILPESFLRKLL